MDKNCRSKKSPMKSLSIGDVARAVGKCMDNGSAYCEEAVLLLNANHYRRAIALAILGIEEVGKIEILGSTLSLTDKDTVEWDKFWTEFTTHMPKQGRALFVLINERFKERGREGFQEVIPITYTGDDRRNPRIDFETVKQQCLYVGYDVVKNEFRLLRNPSKDEVRFYINLLRRLLSHYRILTNFGECKKIAERVKTIPVSEKEKEKWQHCKEDFLRYMDKIELSYKKQNTRDRK